MAILGNMMQVPLLISSILAHAVENNPDQTITTALDDGSLHQYTYSQFNGRVRRLAQGLMRNGVDDGCRVGTLAWNSFRHLEIYYAASGIGAICHTVNPRLHPDQIAYIINHAEDVVLFYDLDFSALVEDLKPRCPTVRHWVALSEDEDSALPVGAHYGDWLAEDAGSFAWPQFDENTASGLCYTSGTTGDPKGALYSHRSTVLHAYASCHSDALGISQADTAMLVVPMFHVNAWGLPYSALMSGAAIVMPGSNLKGDRLYSLCERAGVTLSAGVPTVWQGLLDHVHANGLAFSTLSQIMIGGAACPPGMISAFAELNIAVRHAWGMTEVSPLGTVCRLLPKHDELDQGARLSMLASQGRPLFGASFQLVDDNGSPVPKDGSSPGHLAVRGNWVIERYHGKDSGSDDGWFHTGDVASIDRDGYLRVLDRSKDVIKSGGEWISSIELENFAADHPAVAQVACIAEPHEKWGERPLLVIVLRPGMHATSQDIVASLHGRVPRWSLPDRVVFVDAIPMTATGKIQKMALRQLCLAAQ